MTREGGTVQKIWRVDPRPVEKGGDPCSKVLMWERNTNPPRPQGFVCPVNYDDGSVPDLPQNVWGPNPPTEQPP